MEITTTYVDDIRRAISEEKDDFLRGQLKDLHPADIAELIEELKNEDARYLFLLISEDVVVNVLVELDEDLRQDFLSGLEAEEIVEQFVEEMDSDDAADFINELPEETKDEVVEYLQKGKEAENEIINLLSYDENSAGGLMATELIRAKTNWTVNECISEIRKQAEEVESIYAVYVEDQQNKLTGYINLKNLILSNPSQLIAEISHEKVVSVNVDTSGGDVAEIMRKYDLVALPVVDEDGKLVGRITIDDVVDFIQEEAEEDYQLLSGISEDVEYNDTVWVMSRARLPWLLLGLIGGIASAQLISLNEESIKIYPEMAFFIPLIAAMGGNAGVQASAIVVQGLATKSIRYNRIFEKFVKEFRVSILNGLICGAVLLGYGIMFTSGLNISFTISLSLLIVILLASSFGALIPLLLHRLKIDPALATGPFITTANDIIGLGVYFLIGRLMYNLPIL